MNALSLRLSFLALFLIWGGCDGLVAPPGTADLQLSGTVRDEATGDPIPNARVILQRTDPKTFWEDLTAVSAGADGRYVLTHRLKSVVRDRDFRDHCAVWHRNQTSSVDLRAEAEGYLFATSNIRCTDDAQEVDVMLMPLAN